MLKKIKFRFKWYWIVLGLIFIFLGTKQNLIIQQDLNFKTIDIELLANIPSSQTNINCKISSKKHKATFIILKARPNNRNVRELSKLKEGEQVQIKIRKSDEQLLQSKQSNITVWELSTNGRILFTADDFQKSTEKHHNKRLIILILMGIIFLLNGIIVISVKTHLIIIGIGLIIGIFYRILLSGFITLF